MVSQGFNILDDLGHAWQPNPPALRASPHFKYRNGGRGVAYDYKGIPLQKQMHMHVQKWGKWRSRGRSLQNDNALPNHHFPS